MATFVKVQNLTKVGRFFKPKQSTKSKKQTPSLLRKFNNFHFNRNGIGVWNYFTAVGIGIHFSEFGSKIQDDGRIINPNQDDDDRTRSAINGGNGGTAQIKPDGEFAEHEEKGSKMIRNQ